LPITPQRLVGELEPGIVDLIADMMRKQPELRISSAAEVVERLEQWSSHIDTSTWEELGEYVTIASSEEDDGPLHETTPVESSEITAVRDAREGTAQLFAEGSASSEENAPEAVKIDSIQPAEESGEEFFGLGRPLAALIALATMAALVAIASVITNSL
ncbi:MAG: hypothetical protein RID07_17995, partial [Lacipirellulaceae bacterium]